jgi:type IV secretory pathway protease TraF
MATNNPKILFAFASVGLVFLAVKPFINPVPLVVWNASESVPIGWYFVEKRQIKPTDRVQIYAAERGYLPQDVWLLKLVSASHPSIICRFGAHVFVDGKLATKAKRMDRKHRLLPVWKGCIALSSTQYFVLGRHHDSFDSRYFGPIEQRQVVGTALSLSGLFK